MTEFVGTLVNKTTGVTQNVVSYSEQYSREGYFAGVGLEGDSLSHDYLGTDYDFIPARKPIGEQFAELAIGDVFYLQNSRSKSYRVKVSDTQYYGEWADSLHLAAELPAGIDITKKED